MTVVTVTVVIFVTLVIVTVATVAVGTVVIVTYFSKNNLTPQQQMRYSQGSFSRLSRCFLNPLNILNANWTYGQNIETCYTPPLMTSITFLEVKVIPADILHLLHPADKCSFGTYKTFFQKKTQMVLPHM